MGNVHIELDGEPYECADGETILDAVLRQGGQLPHSCRRGTCHTCLIRCTDGAVDEAAAQGLSPTLRARGHLLACRCVPTGDMRLSSHGDVDRIEVTVVEKVRASADVCRLLLRAARPLDYRAGQFVNLRRADGLTRSYSLASVPGLDQTLELHVRRYRHGAMSRWLYDEAAVGETMHVIGPHGACFYLPGRPEQPLLLIGTGTGLAPLLGIARDALHAGHRGPIRLYHGSHRRSGLYADRQLRELAGHHSNFEFVTCISGPTDAPGTARGRADALALSEHPALSGFRVFSCGLPAMVRSVRKRAYLAGAALADILADGFEMASAGPTPPARG